MITYAGMQDNLMLFTDSVTGSTFSVPSGSGVDELEAILMAVRERFAFAAEHYVMGKSSDATSGGVYLAPVDIEMMRCPICLTWLSYIMDSHGMVDLPVRWVVCRQCGEGGEMTQIKALRGIEGSAVFTCIGTEDYFNNCSCLAQAEHAKILGKPFFIALQEGVMIPEFFLEGVQRYAIATWETPADFPRVVTAFQDFMKGGDAKK